MRLNATPCPCGCKNFIVGPMFNSVDASIPKDEADELVRRWNMFEPSATNPLDTVVTNRYRQWNGETAEWLIRNGYLRTSRKYRTVSRIDRPDWLELMCRAHGREPWMYMVPGHAKAGGSAGDHYRRVYSQDSIESVPQDVFAEVPASLPYDEVDVGYTGAYT